MAGWVKAASAHGNRLDSRWVRVQGQEMHYRRSLDPPAAAVPLVLVHGMASGRYFLPLTGLLAPHRRVYLPDLPGFGGSEAGQEPLPLRALAERLLLWVEACGLPRAHFVGQSLGCSILTEALAAAPEKAASVTLQGVMLAPSLRRPRRFAPRWLLNALYETFRPAPVRLGQREVHPKQLAMLAGAMFAHRIETRLPLLPGPALVLQAEHDPMVPRHWAERAAALLPQGGLQLVPGTSHTMSGRMPAAFAAALTPFLAESEQCGSGGGGG